MQIHVPDKSNQQQIQRKIRNKVIIVSIFFYLITVTYSSFSVIVIYIHQKYKHKGYGESYLTANSFASVITYIFCPFILEKAKNKSKMLLLSCSVGYLINMLIPAILSVGEGEDSASSPPSTFRFISQIIANCIGGTASGILWVLQSIYVANYCEILLQNRKGKYFSISNAILNSRIIVAPLITLVGLGMGSQTTYFSILTSIVLISFPIGMYLIPPINLVQLQQKKLSNNTSQSDLAADRQNQKTKMAQYIISFIKYFKKMKYLILSSLLAGLIVSFVSSSLSHFLPKPQLNESNDTKVSIALVFFGIGNILGGYLSGIFCDRLKIKTAGYIVHFVVIIGSIVQAISLYTTKQFWKSCLIGFMSGFSYSYLYSYVGIVCAIHYKGNSLSFSTNKLVTNLSYIGYQWTVNFLNNQCNMKLNMTYQGLALIPIAIIAAYCISLETKNHQKKQNQRAATTDNQFQTSEKQVEQNKQNNSQLDSR